MAERLRGLEVVTWAKLRDHCCGKTNQNGQALLGRGDSSLANPGHPWPLWVAEEDTSGCELAKNSSGNGLDLSKKFSTWHALGMDLNPMKISLIEKA